DEGDAREGRARAELLVHRVRDRGPDDRPPRATTDESGRERQDRVAVEEDDEESAEDEHQAGGDEQRDVRVRDAEELPGTQHPADDERSGRREDGPGGDGPHREDGEAERQSDGPEVLEQQVLSQDGHDESDGPEDRDRRPRGYLTSRRPMGNRLWDVPDRADDVQFRDAPGCDDNRRHGDEEADRESVDALRSVPREQEYGAAKGRGAEELR